MKPGYYVIPLEKGRLRSGSETYMAAVCVSLEPFLLVSLGADMLWSQVQPNEVVGIGPAEFEVVERCRHRAIRDGLLTPDATQEAPAPSPANDAERLNRLQTDLAAVLNRHCVENWSNTPDFILAGYLVGCLEVFAPAVNARESWYGRQAASPWKRDPIESVEIVTPPVEPAEQLVHRLLAASGLSTDAILRTDLIYTIPDAGPVIVMRNRYGNSGFMPYSELRRLLLKLDEEGKPGAGGPILQLTYSDLVK